MQWKQTGTIFTPTPIPKEEQRLLKHVFTGARNAGYTRFIDLSGSSLQISEIARQSGYAPSEITAYASEFYQTVWGYAVAGLDLSDLLISIDGNHWDDMADPATVIWAAIYSEHEAKGDVAYYNNVVRHYSDQKAEYIEGLTKSIGETRKRLGNIKFKAANWKDGLRAEAKLENTLIYVNPRREPKQMPDTVTWHNPFPFIGTQRTAYEGFLYSELEKSDAMLVACMEGLPDLEFEDGCVFYARGTFSAGLVAKRGEGSLVQNYVTNRRKEVQSYLHRLYAHNRFGWKLEPCNIPTLPEGYEFSSDSTIEVVLVKDSQAHYFKSLWSHNFVGSNTSGNVGMIVDGYLAGLFCYDARGLTPMSAFSADEDSVLLIYGIHTPQMDMRWRHNRLLTMVAMNINTIGLVVTSSYMLQKCRRLKTIQHTKYPETKKYRGILKMKSRDRDKFLRGGYRLVYEGDVTRHSLKEVYNQWYSNEVRYKKVTGK